MALPSSFAKASGSSLDIEMGCAGSNILANTAVDTFSWNNVNVLVKDRMTKTPLSLLSSVAGLVRAGEMLAIMGPSGSGKTTLLNALAHRVAAAGATTTGKICANGQQMTRSNICALSSYVEQEDALIGSLTVRETMMFAAQLSLPRNVSRKEAFHRVDDLIASFGLQLQANTIVGTPWSKGLSGGQKKRLSVASRLVTNPKILFLDEPTSGLDSALSREVCNYIKAIGKANNLVIVASIHQPSSTTFHQFDKLCLLSGGRTCYFGGVAEAPAYFARIGYPVPPDSSSPEHFLDLVNTDIDTTGEIRRRTDEISRAWNASDSAAGLQTAIGHSDNDGQTRPVLDSYKADGPRPWVVPAVLLHRSWIKSYRDVMAYGIRLAMYLGLAILMGTVFLRLQPEQKYIQPYTNAIFFGGAFMSFMAVAYVPAFLEDLGTFKQERANGLVTPLSFLVPNFLIGLPFLFFFALIFSVIVYWLSNFTPSGSAFFKWVLWLFLDLIAAESLVVLVSSIFNVFVLALAVTAFANGLWMCVDGFLVPMSILNVFWKYVFHYIDYQAYVFQGMMVNEFAHREYRCAKTIDGLYQCSYSSDLNNVGKIRGTDVLKELSIHTGQEGTWIGIMIGIIAGYRVLAYLVLVLRK